MPKPPPNPPMQGPARLCNVCLNNIERCQCSNNKLLIKTLISLILGIVSVIGLFGLSAYMGSKKFEAEEIKTASIHQICEDRCKVFGRKFFIDNVTNKCFCSERVEEVQCTNDNNLSSYTVRFCIPPEVNKGK
jgi:hypothetical protein